MTDELDTSLPEICPKCSSEEVEPATTLTIISPTEVEVEGRCDVCDTEWVATFACTGVRVVGDELVEEDD